MQFAEEAFRGELASWIRDPEAGDGMLSHGVPSSAVGESLQAFFRTFDAGGQVAQDERELALGSPLLAVLGTEDDDGSAWLASGQALAKVLLTATAAGVSASFLNQPIQVPSQRPLVAQAIGRSGYPQLVLRLGYGPPANTRRVAGSKTCWSSRREEAGPPLGRMRAGRQTSSASAPPPSPIAIDD